MTDIVQVGAHFVKVCWTHERASVPSDSIISAQLWACVCCEAERQDLAAVRRFVDMCHALQQEVRA